MSPMPEQNPLPFPDEPSSPPPAPSPEPPAPEPKTALAVSPAPVRQSKRPLWARLMSKLADPWLTLNIEPEDPRQQIDTRPVCYVLEDYGLSNALILDRACRDAGLPSPLLPLPGDPLGRKRAYVALSRRNASALIPEPGSHKTHSGSLARLLQAHRAQPELDVQLVPVSIFVGRAPDKTSGWFSATTSRYGQLRSV